MAGRPRKPTQLHILHGNPGKRPLPKGEPQPTLGIPSRPEWLSPEAKREWNRVTKELDALGLLAKVDRALLASYCECWGTYVAAVRALRAKRLAAERAAAEAGEQSDPGSWLTFTTQKGYVGQAPEIGIMKAMTEKMQQLSARFGFTPADRSKMAMPEVQQEDPLAAFLSRGTAANE